MDGSSKFSLAKKDYLKIGKGALIAAAGAVLAYLSTQVFPQLQSSGEGILITIAVIGAVLVNAAQKYLQDTTEKLEASPVEGEGEG